MKNLNKRSTITLAVVGLVVVAVVAVAVFTPVGGGDLFGTAVLAITPANPTFVVGNSTGLSVNAVYNCAWSSSNTAVVSLVNYSGETKAVRVQGNAAGSATITAKCGLGAINVNSVSTTVTVLAVLAITPANPNVILGNTVTLAVPTGYTCTWEISGGLGASFVGANSGSSVTVRGTAAGPASVWANCGTWGAVNTLLAVNNLVFSQNPIIGTVGQTTLRVNAPTGHIYPCTWTTSSPDVQFWVNNQPTSAPQSGGVVTLYFNTRFTTGGIASITISCSAGQSAVLRAKSCNVGDTACLNDKSF